MSLVYYQSKLIVLSDFKLCFASYGPLCKSHESNSMHNPETRAVPNSKPRHANLDDSEKVRRHAQKSNVK